MSWRLGAWASANDEAAHPCLIGPERYLGKDENGTVLEPGKWVRKRYTGTNRGDASERPDYAVFSFTSDSAEAQFNATLKATLMVLQLAPALLGWEFGAAKESGEAKSLGMSTSEAAARRDLLFTAPIVDDALTAMLTSKGSPAEVTVEWRVGIPKSETERQADVIALHNAGLLSLKGALTKLHSNATEEEIDAMLAEIKEENAVNDPLTSFMG